MKIKTYLFCAGASVLAMAGPAFGQAVPSSSTPAAADAVDDTGALAATNDIVVTARRREETVQDVPQTVNVVTSAQVEKLNLRNFTEIQSVVPGLQMQSNGAFSNTATVRGIAFSPEASGNNPSVEFYLNDAPISSAFLFQSTFDFGQFELQRGPQGTLRGRAAPSGSITVTTRRPDLNEVGVVMNGTLTNRHARKLDGAFNIPIIADVLAVRVAGVVDHSRGGNIHSISEETNPQFSRKPYRKTMGIRGSVRFEPTDWAQFNVMYQDLHSDDHNYGQVVSDSLVNPAAAPRTTRLIGPYDRLGIDEQGAFNRQDQKVLVGNVDLSFAGQRLSYVGSYNKQDNGILAPADSGNFFSPAQGIAIAARTPGDPAGFDPVCQDESRKQGAILTTGAYNQCTHTSSKRKSHELRLASEERIAGIFDYVVGGFYDHPETPSNLTQEVPLVTNGSRVGNPNRLAILRRGTATEKSVFGNLTAHLLDDKLELSGGLRYIDYENDSLPTLQGAANGTVPCPDFEAQRCNTLGTSGSFKDNATIYTASAKYQVTPDVMVYALTGSSWRPGPRVVGNFSTAQTAREQSFLNLPPETSKSYEVGTKTSFAGGRGRFNIAGYYQKFENYPFRGPGVFFISTSGSTGAQEVANFNFVSPVPVTVKGVEGELSYQLLDRWSLGLNASYADGKIKNGTIACTDLDRNGVPDLNPATPTVAQLQDAVGAGQTISQCSGLNRRSSTSPKFSANVQSEYGFDLGSTMDGFVRGLYSFYGKTQNDPDNSLDDVGAYGLLNLYAGIRDKDGAWELTVFGKNITREREILTLGNTPASTTVRELQGRSVVNRTFVSQYRSISVTAPREFGVTARVALGSR